MVGSTLDCSLHDRGEENGLNYMTVIVTEPFDTEGIKELTKDKYIEKILVSCKFLYTEYDIEDGVLSYEKLGFVLTGERKNYYKDPVEDAVLMVRASKADFPM